MLSQPKMIEVNSNTYFLLVIFLLIAAVLPLSQIAPFSLKSDIYKFDVLLSLLGPAIVASMFIERAVEVFVVGHRKFGREELEARLEISSLEKKNLEKEIQLFKEKKTKVDDSDNLLVSQIESSITELSGRHKELEISLARIGIEIERYRIQTLKLSFHLMMIFSFVVSLLGVRLLTPLFDIPFMDCLTWVEIEPEECPSNVEHISSFYNYFVMFDTLISTLVLAGGSSGIHSIVSAITQFADNSKKNTSSNRTEEQSSAS